MNRCPACPVPIPVGAVTYGGYHPACLKRLVAATSTPRMLSVTADGMVGQLVWDLIKVVARRV